MGHRKTLLFFPFCFTHDEIVSTVYFELDILNPCSFLIQDACLSTIACRHLFQINNCLSASVLDNKKMVNLMFFLLSHIVLFSHSPGDSAKRAIPRVQEGWLSSCKCKVKYSPLTRTSPTKRAGPPPYIHPVRLARGSGQMTKPDRV